MYSLQDLSKSRDFPGGAAVKTPRFQCRGGRFDPFPGWGARIPHAIWHDLQEKKEEEEVEANLTNRNEAPVAQPQPRSHPRNCISWLLHGMLWISAV